MKQFKNPQIKIFEFSAKDTIIMASEIPGGGPTDGSESGGSGEGWSLRNLNSPNTQVNIGTMTK